MNVFPFYDDILITLHTGGILRLMASQQYTEDLIRVDLRIFSAYTDNQQGILWMGTDGAGVVKLLKEMLWYEFNAKSHVFICKWAG